MLQKNRLLIVSLVLCFVFVQTVFAENQIILPNDLKIIQQEAFAGIPIEKIDLPEGLVEISFRAFAYTGMNSVYIPKSVQRIAEDAFLGCQNLIFLVYAGSYADDWCTSNEFNCHHVQEMELGAEYHTQQQIRIFANSHPVDLESDTTFRQLATGDPDPFAPGLISNESLESAVNMVNQIRYIVGLNADVVNDPTYERQAASAAFVDTLLGELTHTPGRPAVLEDSSYDSLYNDAYAGASNSNLHANWEGNSATSVLAYMNDSDDSNIAKLGHRRWVMNTQMKKTGFGVADLDYDWQIFAMYISDTSGSFSSKSFAWPAQQTPISYFNHDPDIPAAWSVSLGNPLSESAVKVTLTRKRDGKTWYFSSAKSDGDFYINNDNYELLSSCVIFRPENLGTIQDGDIFEVIVRDDNTYSALKYSVTFFNL